MQPLVKAFEAANLKDSAGQVEVWLGQRWQEGAARMRVPFHCGSQYADWTERNCFQCVKGIQDPGKYRCALQEALDAAYCEGDLTDEVCRRIGTPDDCTVYSWDCPEKVE